jgi:SAM-dependent methyltransferase
MKSQLLPQADFNTVIAEYAQREPPGIDTWNPLGDDVELWHRVRLFLALALALRQILTPIGRMRVLDVGCGVGRSTRALLEFGARPENLLGIDLRPSAISYAQDLNPGIPFKAVKNFDDWPGGGLFDLCIQCTVFSSVNGTQNRVAIAQMMERSVTEGGYIFWWDLIRANDFAGGNLIDPRGLFQGSATVDYQELCLRPTLTEALRHGNKVPKLMSRQLQHSLGFAATHCAALFRKGQLV